MKKIEKMLLNKFAAAGKFAAIKAAGAVSICGCHQPKEPKALQNLKK